MNYLQQFIGVKLLKLRVVPPSPPNPSLNPSLSLAHTVGVCTYGCLYKIFLYYMSELYIVNQRLYIYIPTCIYISFHTYTCTLHIKYMSIRIFRYMYFAYLRVIGVELLRQRVHICTTIVISTVQLPSKTIVVTIMCRSDCFLTTLPMLSVLFIFATPIDIALLMNKIEYLFIYFLTT